MPAHAFQVPASGIPELVGSCRERFRQCFGYEPRWAAAAPGRVNLIGEHVDYNDGLVLPMAIDRYTVVVAGARGPAPPPAARIFSSVTNDEAQFAVNRSITRGEPSWSNYIRGVVSAYLERGIEIAPFDAVIGSDVPVGGGLSSSAALEVAVATLIESMTGAKVSTRNKALMCQWAEHNFAGVPCGIMDQFASAFGREGSLLLIDCRTLEVHPVELGDPGVSVLIINSSVSHALTGGEYAQRRAQCEAAAKALGVRSLRDVTAEQLESAKGRMDPLIYRRVRHVVGEIARTAEAAAAISRREWTSLGRLMYASHDSLRDDYEVSCLELDYLVEGARAIGERGGVIGSRMTGGGFGGCTVSLVRSESALSIIDAVCSGYRSNTGISPSAFLTRPSRGAHAIELATREACGKVRTA